MNNSRIILEGCIKSFKEINEIELNESELFEIFTISQLYKDKSITYENIVNSIVDGSKDGGIDSLMVFVDEEFLESQDEMESFDFSNKTETKFVITQCKKEKSFKESTLDKLIATIPILLNLEQDESMLLNRFNSDLITQVLLLREVWQKTAINGGQVSIEFNYSCNASRIEVNNTFKEKQKQLIEIASDNISSSDISFNLYSSIELLEFY